MRAELERWVTTYPVGIEQQALPFRNNPLATLVARDVPAAIRASLPPSARSLAVMGSVGKGGWTQTPWIMILDPSVTTSVQEGYYVAYILSADRERLYLSINQGCTVLREQLGTRRTRDLLRTRAQLMWTRIAKHTARLTPLSMDLAVARSVWRGKLYEYGAIAGRSYNALSLPSEDELLLDLFDAVRAYEVLKTEGGWSSEDAILGEADEAGVRGGLRTARRYHQHRSIERQRSHSEKVKRLQGTRCKGCDLDMVEVYGPEASGLIDAHHLTPLSLMTEGEEISFDPISDFAVLCPNCHRLIHRLPDASDVSALRALVCRGALHALFPARPYTLLDASPLSEKKES